MNKDLYKVLQVDPAADPEVIEAAYQRLTVKFSKQPAADPSENQSRRSELDLAYSVLSDPISRGMYDRGEFQFKSTLPPAVETDTLSSDDPAPAAPSNLRDWLRPLQDPRTLRRAFLVNLLLLPLAITLLTGLSSMPELARQFAVSYQISRSGSAVQTPVNDSRLSGPPRELDLQQVLSIPQEKALNIKKIISTYDSLYMLDGARNRVLRVRRGDTYTLDPAFECASGESITDIAHANRAFNAIGSGNDNNLLAITAQGRLYVCSPETADFLDLVAPPMGWNHITGIRPFGDDQLLVMDPGSNAVFLSGIFDSPSYFLPSQVPDVSSLADWMPIQEELLLLNRDGSMLSCVSPRSAAEADSCRAVLFRGSGLPAEGAAYLEGLQFSQLAANQPAEQSFYLLEAGRQELFHLNRAYEILEVLAPSELLPEEPISAFTIGQDRVLFVAIGGKIFTAQLP